MTISAFIRTLLDAPDAETARATLGVTQTNLGVSAFAQTLLDDANAAAARTTLELGTAAVVGYSAGTWTPILTTTGTDFTSVTYDAITGGKYVRIGNLVYAQGVLRTDAITVGSATGAVVIGDLPVTVGASTGSTSNGESPVNIGFVRSWTTNPKSGTFLPGTTGLILYEQETLPTADMTGLDVADVATGANGNEIYFSGLYIAS